jgi:hypothetical protein
MWRLIQNAYFTPGRGLGAWLLRQFAGDESLDSAPRAQTSPTPSALNLK